MKKYSLIFCSILIGSICMALVRKNFNGTFAGPVQKTEVSAAIGCAPVGNENIYADNSGKFITIFPGWGNHSYSILPLLVLQPCRCRVLSPAPGAMAER